VRKTCPELSQFQSSRKKLPNLAVRSFLITNSPHSLKTQIIAIHPTPEHSPNLSVSKFICNQETPYILKQKFIATIFSFSKIIRIISETSFPPPLPLLFYPLSSINVLPGAVPTASTFSSCRSILVPNCAGHQWLTPAILATQEVEIRRFMV
jgi:hypothetical protein